MPKLISDEEVLERAAKIISDGEYFDNEKQMSLVNDLEYELSTYRGVPYIREEEIDKISVAIKELSWEDIDRLKNILWNRFKITV